MSDNVIKGPWGDKAFKLTNEDHENAEIVDQLTTELSSAVFDTFREAGFDNYEDMCYTKDYALIHAAIKSAIFKLQDRYYPLQEVSEHLFNLEADGSVTTNYSLHLDFE